MTMMKVGKNMTEIVYQLNVNYSIQTVWRFVHDLDHWAPIIPGYVSHKKLSNHETELAFKINIGFLKKTVKLNIQQTKLIRPQFIAFRFSSPNQNFHGSGLYKAQTRKGRTQITLKLNVASESPYGGMIDSFLQNVDPEKEQEFISALEEKIKEYENS